MVNASGDRARRPVGDEASDCYEIAWSVAERLDEPMLLWQRATMQRHAGPAGRRQRRRRSSDHRSVPHRHRQRPAYAACVLAVQSGAGAGRRGSRPATTPRCSRIWPSNCPTRSLLITSAFAQNHVGWVDFDDAHRLLRAFAASGFDLPPEPASWSRRWGPTSVAVACRDAETPKRCSPAEPVRRPGPHDRHPSVRPHRPGAR